MCIVHARVRRSRNDLLVKEEAKVYWGLAKDLGVDF